MKFQSHLVRNVDGVPDYSILEFNPRKTKFALVIPVINEGFRIIEQLRKIDEENLNIDIVIADGGTTDESASFFKSGRSNLRTLLTKHGPGRLSAQLRMAFHYCTSQGYEAVITMDGNDKDGARGISRISAALEDGFDFVQGSRFRKGGLASNTPFLRYFAIRFIHAPLTSLAAGYWFTDTTNGFRGHRIQALESKEISIYRDVFEGYELLAYLPIRISRSGYRVCEVPVSRMYPKSQEIPTKIHGARSLLRILQILLRSAKGSFNP